MAQVQKRILTVFLSSFKLYFNEAFAIPISSMTFVINMDTEFFIFVDNISAEYCKNMSEINNSIRANVLGYVF